MHAHTHYLNYEYLCLFHYIYIYIPISIYLYPYIYIYIYIGISICYIFISISIYLPIYLSIYLSILWIVQTSRASNPQLPGGLVVREASELQSFRAKNLSLASSCSRELGSDEPTQTIEKCGKNHRKLCF